VHSFLFVQNSSRAFNQSAAQGYLYSIAYGLRKAYKDIHIGLWVTHELPPEKHRLMQLDRNVIRDTVNYWCQRFSVPGMFEEIFDSLTVLDGEEHMLTSTLSTFFAETAASRCIFFFCTSYPSPAFRDKVSNLGARTVYLTTAPTRPLDLNFDIITDTMVDSELVLGVRDRLVSLLPARWPIFFGSREARGDAPLNSFTSEGSGPVILTSGERIDQRLTKEDVAIVIPSVLSQTDASWFFVGVSASDVKEMFIRHMGEVEALQFLKAFGHRISVLPRIEEFALFLKARVSIFYSGCHTGGGTTCALAVNLGIPVVEYFFADARIFLPRQQLCNCAADAVDILVGLSKSSAFRKEFARTQNFALDYANKNWGYFLFRALGGLGVHR
jgi:hypothetical protein